MLIVAARWVQLSKEEFAAAYEFWSPGLGRRFRLGWNRGRSDDVSEMETSGAGLKPSAGRTVNVPDLIARSRWAVLEKRQRADCPLTDVTDVNSIFKNGQHLFTQM